MKIQFAEDPASINKCWAVMYELRPHLIESNFVKTIQRLQASGYWLIFIEEDGVAVAAAGFELGEKLHRGKYLYVDDLTTLPAYRKKGYGSHLLDWIFNYAREQKCDSVHLDSGVQRFDAHRLYLQKGFHISSHHFARRLEEA